MSPLACLEIHYIDLNLCTEWLRLAETLAPNTCSSRVTWGRLSGAESSQVLNVLEDRDSTTFLGNLF